MSEEYWKIFCDEVIPDILDISVTKEQAEKLARAASTHRDLEYDYCGYKYADDSVKRLQEEEAQGKVFAFIENLMREMDNGGSQWFHLLSEHQKAALACLGHARQEFARQQRNG